MSRIEEALRRSGALGVRPVPATSVPPSPDPAVLEPAELEPEEAVAPNPAPVEAPWQFDAEKAPVRPMKPRPAAREREIEPPVELPPQDPGPRYDVPAPDSGAVSDETSLFVRRLPEAVSEKLVAATNMPSVPVEQYRKLAATLHHAQMDRDIHIVMIASALAGEGKTLTATNLALTLSESYRRRVLVIDADLRRPSLHNVFQVPNVTGLTDGLNERVDRKLALVQITPTLTVLTAGKPDPDPMSLLTSPRMRAILKEAASAFDWVILDTPPVGLMPDANLLAAMVDAAVMVVRSGRTPSTEIQRAITAVGRDRVLGVVLNQVHDTSGLAGYRYGNGYGYGYGYGYGRRTK